MNFSGIPGTVKKKPNKTLQVKHEENGTRKIKL